MENFIDTRTEEAGSQRTPTECTDCGSALWEETAPFVGSRCRCGYATTEYDRGDGTKYEACYRCYKPPEKCNCEPYGKEV